MKKIPTTFELSEEDIKEAISFWLSRVHEKDNDGNWDYEYDIVLNSERKDVAPYPGACSGGMSDWSREVITATAAKKE
jgi:hypothetical protein